MNRKLTCVLFIVLISEAVFSQTTEFTYQGSLKVGPSPAIASATTTYYDFDFRLCTTDTINCSVAPGLIGIHQHSNVPVTDGLFTVKLNFSAANAFDGSPRWLQIAVKPAGDPGGYLVLSPRQQLTSAPYAIRSKNSEQLGGIAASQYLQTNGNGSGLTSLNAGNITTGTLAIANGGTGSSTKNFVDLSTDQTSIGGNKTFTGNTVSVQNDFVANTIDANGLSVFGNGVVTGNLGIGTNTPAGKFHVNVPGSGNPISALTVDVGTFGTGANSINSYFFRARDLGLGGTPAFLIRGDGNVGIGTATPTSKLYVSGAGGIRANVNSDSNAGLGLTLNNTPKWSIATVTPGQFQIFNDAIGQNAVWIDPANNNVGIGTNAPSAKLEVNGNIKATGNITGPRTTMVMDSGLIITPSSSPPTLIPGLSQTIVVSGSAKLLVHYNVLIYTGQCVGCISTSAYLDIMLNDGLANRVKHSLITGFNPTEAFMSGSWLLSVGSGTHTVELRGHTTGQSVAFGCGPSCLIRSSLIVQVIPD